MTSGPDFQRGRLILRLVSRIRVALQTLRNLYHRVVPYASLGPNLKG